MEESTKQTLILVFVNLIILAVIVKVCSHFGRLALGAALLAYLLKESFSNDEEEEEGGGAEVSARSGMMTPNPRRTSENEKQDEEEVLRHGHPSFTHVRRRSQESQARLREALIKESLQAGFRP